MICNLDNAIIKLEMIEDAIISQEYKEIYQEVLDLLYKVHTDLEDGGSIFLVQRR